MNLFERLDAVADRWNVLRHPFYERWECGALSREELAQRWLPMLSGGYLVRAQKRVHPLTPVRMWRRPARLRVVGGLVEPTTRSPLPRVSILPTGPDRRGR